MRKRVIIPAAIILILVTFAIYWPNRWNYIVIHHSAGNYGNIEFIQKVHRERQPTDPIDAIAYHYIIGNGNGMEDGKTDSDNRRKYHLWGAHVSANNMDKNFRGLGICLIGNLDKKEMTAKQYKSLVKLTITLMKKYNIPAENVLFHGKIQSESTRCPGRFFPFSRFKDDITKFR